MTDRIKTKEQLINELNEPPRRIIKRDRLVDKGKQIEEALRESENYYGTLVENLPQKIFLKDKNSVYLSCNKNYSRNLKIRPDEITGKTDYDFYPKELAKKYRADDKRIMESGKTEDIEERYIQDGKEVIVHTVKTPIKDKKCETIGILGIFWDITERKHVEDDLRKYREQLEEMVEKRTAELRMVNEQLQQEITVRMHTEEVLREYQRAIEGSQDIIAVVDQNYSYLLANNAFLKYRGMHREQVIGRSIAGVLGKDVFERVIKKHLDTCFQGQVVQYEMKYTYPEFGERDLLVSYFPIEGPDGVNRVASVIHDITERKRTENALRESEKRYRILFEGSRDAIYFTTREGKIVDANQSMLDLFGYSREEMVGLDARKTYAYPEDRKKFQQQIEREGFVRDYEIKLRKKDGAEMECLLTATVRWDDDGGIIGYQGIIRDVTEYKQVLNELRAEKQRFQTLSENAPFGMVMINKDGAFTYINPKFRELFGYDLMDVPDGKTWFRKAYPDTSYRHNVISTWISDSEGLEPGEKRPRIFTATCKDATEKTINFISVRLEAGEILMACENLTELELAKEAFQRSEQAAKQLAQENVIVAEIGRIISSTLNIEEVYERFAEKVHNLILFEGIAINIINHKEGTVTIPYISGMAVPGRQPGATLPLQGSVTEEVMRTRSAVIVEMEDKNELQARFPALLPVFQKGFRSVMAVPLISKDQVIGTIHFRSAKPKAYSDQDSRLAESIGSQIAGAIANAQLFAERKRAEEAMQKSEEAAKRLAQENSIVAEIGRIITSTLDIEEVYEVFAKEVYKLIPFDRIAINLINFEDNTSTICYSTGLDVPGRRKGDTIPLAGTFTDEAMRTRSSVLIQTEDINEILKRCPGLLSSFHSGFRSMISVPLISKDQVIGVLHLRSIKPNAYKESDSKLTERVGNQISGAIANAQLFAERKRKEEEMAVLQEQLRHSQKMEAIGRLAGGIAHDFNNLLTVIKGYTQLSLLELKEGDPLKGNLEEIQKSSERAADLTRQLLAFSRRQVMEMKVFDLNTLLRDLDKMLRRIIGEDIELSTLLAKDLGRVKIDPGQIEQVIMNLAVNAKDSMPSGGKLTIETANAELDESYTHNHADVKAGHYVMFSVSDTGVGMTPEVRERVFEPFFTTKEKGRGTGLGLSTVYGIVKQSGGNIWVYSEPGHGTTFKIYLPRVDEPLEELREKTMGEELPHGSETVLVVEDEEKVRTLTVEILERQGYRVLDASQGDDALAISEKHKDPIHLFLVDVVMPGISGTELAKHLMSLHPETRILYMSGYTDNVIVHHGVLEKGVNYIQKPFTIDELTRRVREALDK